MPEERRHGSDVGAVWGGFDVSQGFAANIPSVLAWDRAINDPVKNPRIPGL